VTLVQHEYQVLRRQCLFVFVFLSCHSVDCDLEQVTKPHILCLSTFNREL
jgi:hypothetical protein